MIINCIISIYCCHPQCGKHHDHHDHHGPHHHHHHHHQHHRGCYSLLLLVAGLLGRRAYQREQGGRIGLRGEQNESQAGRTASASDNWDEHVKRSMLRGGLLKGGEEDEKRGKGMRGKVEQERRRKISWSHSQVPQLTWKSISAINRNVIYHTRLARPNKLHIYDPSPWTWCMRVWCIWCGWISLTLG